MKKANHIGECQCCGSTQKLPNGLLSLHGYTVDWGCFNGTCAGAYELPYEQSCALIGKFLNSAIEQQNSLLAVKKKLLELATEEMAWFYESKGRHFLWNYLPLQMIDNSPHVIKSNGKTETLMYSGIYSVTLLEAATELNKRYVDRELLKKLSSLATYIKWQTKRVQEWKLLPLQRVPGEMG